MHRTEQAVIVGIDGSRSAIAAALWGADEAAHRDVPLHLVSAVWPQKDLAPGTYDAADTAVRAAIAAVESTGKSVKMESEIVYGRPSLVLQAQSPTAAVVCLGSCGVTHGGLGRIGSTVTAVAAASLACPLAVIHSDPPQADGPGWVVAEVDESPSGERALQLGIDEALLRGATLRVVATWQARYTDIHDVHATSDGNRAVKAHWERRLRPWRQRYPELDVQAAAAHGSVFNFLARHRQSIKLLVLPHKRAPELVELLAPGNFPASRDICFDILLCEAGTGPEPEGCAKDRAEAITW